MLVFLLALSFGTITNSFKIQSENEYGNFNQIHDQHEQIGEENPENGVHMFGDILTRPGEELKLESNPLNAVANKSLLWPDGIIYYDIIERNYTEEQLGQIQSAIDHLVNEVKVNGEYCIQILARRENDTDFVLVGKYSGCSSMVGYRGGVQTMSLVDSCVERNGTIMHEFLHAFGFFHEQNRSDRDDYITVNWDNVTPGTRINFVKLEEGTQVDLLGTPYDYGSVLHYGEYSFAVNESIPTIIPHDPEAEIGQRTHLSEIDIERVQILYGCLDMKDSKYFKDVDLTGFWKKMESED